MKYYSLLLSRIKIELLNGGQRERSLFMAFRREVKALQQKANNLHVSIYSGEKYLVTPDNVYKVLPDIMKGF